MMVNLCRLAAHVGLRPLRHPGRSSRATAAGQACKKTLGARTQRRRAVERSAQKGSMRRRGRLATVRMKGVTVIALRLKMHAHRHCGSSTLQVSAIPLRTHGIWHSVLHHTLWQARVAVI